MVHRRLLLGLALGLAACRSSDVNVEALPFEETIPADAGYIYRIEPTLIGYFYEDSTSGQLMTLRWLPANGFNGYNCVALTPRSPTDSIGTFVFVAREANQGLLERYMLGAADTVPGFFIGAGQGSRGTYVRDAQDRVTLFWANGTPSRYFDPSATMRLSQDSLISDVALSERGDSVSATWHVVWRERPCAP